jgi:ion channel-forming bestrophin family protein
MIVRETLDWRKVAHYTWKPTLTFAGIAAGVCVLYHQTGWTFLSIPAAPLTIMASALAIFLGFRTNSAYDRWWEARTLWGGIVNHSRTLARKVLAYTDADTERREDAETFERQMIYYQMGLVHAIRCHLRKQDPFGEIAPFFPPDVLDDLRNEQNVPAAILHRMGMRLKAGYRRGLFDSMRFVSLQDTLTEMTNLLGGCERIKNTTLPRQYDVFPRLFVYAFNTLLPLALVKDLVWYTCPVSVLISFIFLALDRIGSNIENPFENTIHDTPISSLSRTIEINLRQMLGEKELPPKVEPVDGFLY